MSRQSQLPPRCPLQKKTNQIRPSHDPISTQYQKSLSSTGIWDDHSTNDSGTNLDNLIASLPSLSTPGCDESLSSRGDSGSVLESGCTYGPNSPRAKSKPSFPENRMVTALSEYISQNSVQFLAGDSSGGVVDVSAAGETDSETKPAKRHSGQRSRVRKLQYIAELERTVDIFQSLQSELACKLASSLQHRFSLSLENSNLKQQLIRLQQEKMMLDDEYQMLRNRLDTFASYGLEDAGSNTMWQMLDMGKLDLN